MKNIILLTLLSLGLFSCKKERDIPCNCGEVINTDIITQPGFQYTITVKNACSGSTKTFYVTSSEWSSVYNGDIYCANNISSW